MEPIGSRDYDSGLPSGCLFGISSEKRTFSAFSRSICPASRTVLMSREVGKVVPVRPKNPYKGAAVEVQTFLTSFQDGDDWFSLGPGRFTPKVNTPLPGENKINSMLHNGLLDLMNRSTCFGHYYAHHQELATIQMISASWFYSLHVIDDARSNTHQTPVPIEQEAGRPQSRS